MNVLRLAFGMLTAVPVGRLPTVERRSAAAAMVLAPLTSAPAAVALAAGHLLARLGRAGGPTAPALPLLIAALVLLVEVLLTRAMHLDGLADTADGLSAGYDATTSLQAMKASDIGPSGVAAVVLCLLVQAAGLAVLLPSLGGTVLAAVAWLGSRHVLAWACRRGVPAARAGGLGVLVAGTVAPVALAVAAALAVLVSAAAGVALPAAGWSGPVVLAAAVAAGVVVVAHCRRRLGGITGDVLGAAVEVALTAGLACAAILIAVVPQR